MYLLDTTSSSRLPRRAHPQPLCSSYFGDGALAANGNRMPKLRVQSFAISIDGYGAGPRQDLENPLGVRGLELMEWFFQTRVWRRMHGHEGGETGVDNHAAEEGLAGIGAWI